MLPLYDRDYHDICKARVAQVSVKDVSGERQHQAYIPGQSGQLHYLRII